MNPRQFLLIGGGVLIVVGILGFVGIIGPTPAQSIFGSAWYFDNAENGAHLVLGIVAVVAGLYLSNRINRPLTLIVGLVGVFFGIYSAVFSTVFLGATLQNPPDTLLHFAIGAWALVAGLWNRGVTERKGEMTDTEHMADRPRRTA